jgi:hypothetical protein
MLARDLALELGGLALGLEQAGAYIATERIGFARYLTLWREKRETVLNWFDKALMSYDRDTGVAATWAASVERLTPDGRRLNGPMSRPSTPMWKSRRVQRGRLTATSASIGSRAAVGGDCGPDRGASRQEGGEWLLQPGGQPRPAAASVGTRNDAPGLNGRGVRRPHAQI